MNKEKPIIFNTENVRAILAGKKTQTRRIVKFPGRDSKVLGQAQMHSEMKQAVQIPGDYSWIFWDRITPDLVEFTANEYKPGDGIRCPYGQPGDRLWVREMWSYITKAENENFTHRRPDGCPVEMLYRADAQAEGWARDVSWTPSIHMLRWASRITLEIVQLRVERLQDISESDCYAEGISSTAADFMGEAYFDFRDAWDEIYVKLGFPWASNPFVWVIEFRRL